MVYTVSAWSGFHRGELVGSSCNHMITYIHQSSVHHGVIKEKHFPRYWPFVRGIHRSAVVSPHKGQWRGALMFSLICLNKWLSKQSRSQWFETPSRSLWRHCNTAVIISYESTKNYNINKRKQSATEMCAYFCTFCRGTSRRVSHEKH